VSFIARWVTGAGALVAGALVACGLFWYAVAADRSHPQASKQLVIQRGATFDEVATQLAAGGVIGNTLTFRILARLRDEDAAVRAGEYRFSPHVTQNDVLHALVTGGAQVATWVTIPEGFTAEQIAVRLQVNGLGSSAALRQDFVQQKLLVDGARTKSLEGFLFPSTYLLPLGAAPEQIAALLTGQFLKELPRDAAARARALHVSVPQAVTVASLVEREAKSQADRPQIAAVIYNRLRLGMPLQVDATIEYALPQHKSALSFADLRIDSPYNSYVHAGLPPTPIANPGLASLEAAFRPAKSENLYYVYCGNGRHAFAKTLAEHQANVARCLQ
jgi:UPF0755 protein